MSIARYDLWAIVGAATWPFWLLLFGGLCAHWQHRRAARWFTISGWLLFIAIASSPLSVWLMQPLESRYQSPSLKVVNTIIMLAGAEQLRASLASGHPEYSEAAERIISAVELQKRYPQARLFLVGGVVLPGGKPDVAYARETALALGVPAEKISIITGTSNTYENARAMRPYISGDGRAVLVTSAFHMPRAMLCFRKFGMKPTAYPVDSRLPGSVSLVQQYSLHLVGNFKRFDDAMHEWIGLIAYRWLGYTEHLY
jgi:uncharacterized SAM-binding protein YcdF (DUF218 family)